MLVVLVQATTDRSSHKSNRERIFAEMRPIPKLSRLEVDTGEIIGVGEFGVVQEVLSITLLDEYTDKHNKECEEVRRYMGKHFIRGEKDLRYAIKRFRSDVIQDYYGEHGAGLDLMSNEAKFLTSIEHPNIIKMRAVGNADYLASNFFIILDRLTFTLTHKIYEMWKPQKNKCSKGIVAKFSKDKKAKLNELRAEQVVAAYDLACAFKYMHRKK